MKITKSQLKQIIKEELKASLTETELNDPFDDIYKDRPEVVASRKGVRERAEKQNLINFLMEDGIDVNMNTHMTISQLDAILKISRGENTDVPAHSRGVPDTSSGGGSRPDRNEYMWDQTARAFPEEYEGAENPFKE